MKEETLPKILVVNTTAWNATSPSITMMDIFKWWDKDRIAQIYTKADFPDTNICNNFFQINENLVLKSIFNRHIQTGKRVYNTKESGLSEEEKKELAAEKNRYAKGRKKNSWFLRVARDIVWKLGRWKTPELDKFIEEENPDVLFLPAYPTIYHQRIDRYIIKKTQKPFVLFFTDDFYTYKATGANPLAKIHRFFLRKSLKELIKKASSILVISPKQKEEYDKAFKRETVLFTRGIDPSSVIDTPTSYSHPIKMVYSGNTLIGRGTTLEIVAKCIDRLNSESGGIQMTLDIYSPDSWNTDLVETVNKCEGVSFKGYVEPSKMPMIQKDADVLLFVESLRKKDYAMARLSFSTKLTDYFKSARTIFAVGGGDIAPIEYLISNDAAVVATKEADVYDKLKSLLDTKTLEKYAVKSREIGLKNHNQDRQRKIFYSSILNAYKNDK